MRRPLGLALAMLAMHAAAAPVRWTGNGHLYEVRVDPNGVSWPQAHLRARALGCGWHLASVTSAAENAFVHGLLAGRPEIFEGAGPWLGAFQQNGRAEPAGNWRWVTDEPFAYTNWNGGEPSDNADDEAFLNLFANGAWNDADAFGSFSELPVAFVVEFDAGRQQSCRRRG